MAENFDNLFYLPLSDTSSNSQEGVNEQRNRSASGSSEKNSSLVEGVDTSMDVTASGGHNSPNEPIEYKPINYHWFYSNLLLDKLVWMPMSYKDSANLETYFNENKNFIIESRKKPNVERKESFILGVKGGRFEVDLVELTRRPVYWDDTKSCQVRRCLWFYKENNDQNFMPYDEEYCDFLEKEYEKTLKQNSFHKRIDYIKINQTEATGSNVEKSESSSNNNRTLVAQGSLNVEEAFVFHSTSVMLHFTQANMLDEFGNLSSDANRPRIVKRGIDDVVDREKIEPDEIEKIDHMCFVVHGIGEGCDMKFRSLVECVDDFRDIGASMIESHLKPHIEASNLNGRIEFIPISWHNELHGDATGVDERLKPITLSSIPKLRQYSNTTILDVLFYTSPMYCQTIISKVGNELNRLYKVFMERNPYFNGTISLIGHSLGSLIVFDILLNQLKESPRDKTSPSEDCETKLINTVCFKYETFDQFLSRTNLTEYKNLFEKEKITMESVYLLTEADLVQLGLPLGPRKIVLEEIRSYLLKKERHEVEQKIKSNLETLRQETLSQHIKEKKSADYFNFGLAGTGQLIIKYPQLNFKAKNFFALGSPIAMFMTVRGITKLGADFTLPNCECFYNIFHPYDPVAYRFEPLVCPTIPSKPVLMLHHKGRKRLHIELKEGITKVSEDFKQKMYDQFKNAWSSITEFTKLTKLTSNPSSSQALPNLTVTEGDSNSAQQTETTSIISTTSTDTTITLENVKEQETPLPKKEDEHVKVDMVKMNRGKRIDYVLQERPIESFNEYLFAIASHACYWESEDTLLLLVKEIYDVGYSLDANTELQLTEQQQQLSAWLTQAAASAVSTNVQKTFNYFNFTVPQSFASMMQPQSTKGSSSNLAASTASATSNNSDANSKK